MAQALHGSKQMLDAYYTGTFHLALINLTASDFTATFTNGSPTIAAAGHTFVVDQRVGFLTTGVLPAGLTASVISGSTPGGMTGGEYWVVAAVPGVSIEISATRGGTAIVASGVGTGTHTVREYTPFKQYGSRIELIHPLAAVVRHEIPNYNQVTDGNVRQVVTFSPSVIDVVTGVVATPSVSVVFSPTASITYDYHVLIKGGTSARGNTTGEIDCWSNPGTTQTITTATRTIQVSVKSPV